MTSAEKSLKQLKFDTELRRKESFLSTLLISMLVLGGLVLLGQIIGGTHWYDYLTVITGLMITAGLFWANRRGYVAFASQIFCGFFNLLILSQYILNIVSPYDLRMLTMMAYLLALAPFLARMLINSQASFIFAGFNIAVIAVSTTLFERDTHNAIAFSVPPIVFLVLITILSWLYEKTLAQADSHLAAAQQTSLQAELLQRDIVIAHNLQMGFFPPAPANKNGIQIAAMIEPAYETCGDFYDLFQLDEHRMGIVVADVTGKSLAAAMLMAITRSVLRNAAFGHTHSGSPEQVLEEANRTLRRDLAAADQMVTAFYGIFNSNTLQLVFANAGHPYPLLKRTDRVEELQNPGLPLNTMSNSTYRDHIVQLQPGDQLILYSDGITETQNAAKELFEDDRLKALVAESNHAGNPSGFTAAVREKVRAFQGTAPQSDDITLVIIDIGQDAVTG